MDTEWGADYRQKRIEAELTQDEAARLSGVSQQAISKIERGVVARPRANTLERLEAALAAHRVLRPRQEVPS